MTWYFSYRQDTYMNSCIFQKSAMENVAANTHTARSMTRSALTSQLLADMQAMCALNNPGIQHWKKGPKNILIILFIIKVTAHTELLMNTPVTNVLMEWNLAQHSYSTHMSVQGHISTICNTFCVVYIHTKKYLYCFIYTLVSICWLKLRNCQLFYYTCVMSDVLLYTRNKVSCHLLSPSFDVWFVNRWTCYINTAVSLCGGSTVLHMGS